MRKFLLLGSIFLMSMAAYAQKDTLYLNTFENPGDTNLVSQDTIIRSGFSPSGTPPRWAVVDTFGYNSDSSYHIQGKPSGHVVYFQTTPFSTLTTPYISFSFWHIAKINNLNKGQMYYSINNGSTWQLLPINNYYSGNSPNYGDGGGGQIDWFNQISYGPVWGPAPPQSYLPPLPTWWRKETFDLSGILSDLTVTPAVGYANVMLRFEANVSNAVPLPSGGFASGWYVDDILVEGSPCELNPPKINFNFLPQGNVTGYPNCFEPNPEGAQVQLASGNYPVAARVTDDLKPAYETGVDTVYVVYRVNGGPLDSLGLTKRPNDYRALFPNLAVGDTVEWFMLAYDGGCPPNEARMPDLTYNGTGMYLFWIEKGLPGKCGAPNCGAAPFVIRTFPWTENFDGPKWVPGNATNPQGSIPTDEYWDRNYGNVTYGWTVGSGATPSIYTGPSGDHTSGTGNYLFLESDGTPNLGAAQLNTPCIDLTQQTGCWAFEFYYHMFGSEIGDLILDIDTGQGIVSIPADIFKAEEVIGEHQTSSSEPWQRAVVSLEPYVGKYIKLRFRARNPSPTAPVTLGRNDIAIDDLRIFVPAQNDAEVIANPEPKNGYCDYAGQPVRIVIRNNGCTPLTSVPVRYNLSSNPGTVFSETATISPALELGDTVVYTFTNTFPTIAPGIHKVKAWSALSGDAKNDNDTTRGPDLEYLLPITTFPLIEDFENATVGTQNLGNTDWIFSDGLDPNYKWQVDEEMTDERATGPFRGYHHKGKYIYTQSNTTSGGLSTFMRTKCLDFGTLNNPVLYFYYHMYGANIDKLEVQASAGDEPLDKWTTLTTISAGGKQTKEMDDWRLQRVDLSAYANSSVKLRFKATRKGTGDKTHLALDKIMIYDEATNDAGGYVIDGPRNRGITAGPNGPNDPEVSIANFGSTALTTCTVNFRITLKCNPSVTNTYQYYYNGGSINSGDIKKINLSSLPINYPVGEFEACVWVTAPNGSADANTFNDTICRNIIGGNISYNIPWKQNFDTCDFDSDGFINSQGFWQWELGSPSAKTPSGPGLIRDDRSGGGNAWVTNIDGTFLVGTTEQLRLPVYEEFDTVQNAQLRFYQVFDFGSNTGSGSSYNVGGVCLYFNQGWKILGGNTVVKNLGVNWYGGNDAGGPDPIREVPNYPANSNGAPLVDLFGGPAWVGNPATNGQWRYTSYPLNGFSLDPNAALALRFEFQSDPGMPQSNARGGWGIDDFEIYVPPQNSVRPRSIRTASPLPLPGFEQTLILSVSNSGEKTIDSCMVDISIGGVPLGPSYKLEFNPPIAKGEVRTDTVPYKWLAADVTSGDHEVCIITSRPNDKPDQIPSDDTLCDNLPVMLELDFTATGQDEYCEDFESSTTFQWITKNAQDLYISKNAWEKGNPTQIGAAHSGTNAWMTDLDSNYKGLEQSALFTPVLEIDSGIVYNIEFYHWFDTEKYHDGGNVEYSFDGGITWYPIGYVRRDDTTANWYNTEFVTALDQIRGGWTDKSNGWELADYRVEFLDKGKLILRFRFGSDYDINGAGWAIDDFCFSKDTSGLGAEQRIGEGELALPEEAVVGNMVPNPATDYSELSFLFPTPQNVDIKVYNLVGQMMEARSSKFTEGAHTIGFNTANWSAGVYFVNFEYGGKLVTRKLVVK